MPGRNRSHGPHSGVDGNPCPNSQMVQLGDCRLRSGIWQRLDLKHLPNLQSQPGSLRSWLPHPRGNGASWLNGEPCHLLRETAQGAQLGDTR